MMLGGGPGGRSWTGMSHDGNWLFHGGIGLAKPTANTQPGIEHLPGRAVRAQSSEFVSKLGNGIFGIGTPLESANAVGERGISSMSGLAPCWSKRPTMSAPQPRRAAQESGCSHLWSQNGSLAASWSTARTARTSSMDFFCNATSSGGRCRFSMGVRGGGVLLRASCNARDTMSGVTGAAMAVSSKSPFLAALRAGERERSI